MPSPYDELKTALLASSRRWLVTGAAGFIGSHLVELLLKLDQTVLGLDNFSTGKPENLKEVEAAVAPPQWRRFRFVEGDICSSETCKQACRGADFVLHQAALGSVPRSIADPIRSHDSNVNGFLNMLVAARDAGVRRFVYASSSSVYGDRPDLPKQEDRIGRPLSPYAVTKQVNELYADVFARCYGLEAVGLRYFNVFGPRQDPNGPYAAVIPKWIAAMLHGNLVHINGDGETSRDFCYVANVVQANLLAATAPLNPQPSAFTPQLSSPGPRPSPLAPSSVFNIALNDRTTLNQLFELIRERLAPGHPHLREFKPTYRDFRAGDVRHSQADISRAQTCLGYQPTHTIAQGLDEALGWYRTNATAPSSRGQVVPSLACLMEVVSINSNQDESCGH